MAIINKKDEPVKAKKDTTKKKGLTEEEFRDSLAEIDRVQDSLYAKEVARSKRLDAEEDSIRVSKGLKPYNRDKRKPKVTELPLAKEETMPNAFQRFFNFANEHPKLVYPLLGAGADFVTGTVMAGIPKTRTVDGGWTPNFKKNMGKLWRLGNLTSTGADITFLRNAFPDFSLTEGIKAAKQVAWKPFTDNIKNAFFEPKIGREVSPEQMRNTPDTPSSGGKKGGNQSTIGKNVSIENPGNAPETPKTRRAKVFNINRTQGIVPQNVSKLINSPKPKLDLKSGVGALAALALNDQFGEFRENPDRSFVENVSGGLETTVKGFKPSSVLGGASGIFNAMGEVSENLPMGKGELLSKGFKVIGGGLGKASEWVDDKERSVFDSVGHEYDRRREEADKGYGVIGQTRSDFRKEYWGEKEPPLGSAVTGMDLFNVGTKGMSTKKGVESFDKMLVDLGYNPNELTTKQKVSMMKRGKGLIQKK